MCKFKKIYIGFIPAAKLLSDLSQFILLWIFIKGTTAPSSVQYMLLSFKKIYFCVSGSAPGTPASNQKDSSQPRTPRVSLQTKDLIYWNTHTFGVLC